MAVLLPLQPFCARKDTKPGRAGKKIPQELFRVLDKEADDIQDSAVSAPLSSYVVDSVDPFPSSERHTDLIALAGQSGTPELSSIATDILQRSWGHWYTLPILIHRDRMVLFKNLTCL